MTRFPIAIMRKRPSTDIRATVVGQMTECAGKPEAG